MKNSFQNKIWIIQISNYTVWINKHISNISEINQSCIVWSSEWVYYHISEWHFDIFWDRKEAWETCQENFEKISRKKTLSQVRKIWISQTTSQISRTYHHDQKIKNEFRKNKNDIEIFNIWIHQKYTSISETSKILLKIYYKFHQNHYIIDWFIIKE